MSKTTKTIQEKMTELSELLAWFQSDEFVLEEAIGRYETAEKLAGEIEQDLKQLKNDITVVAKRFDGAER